ncbi:MAG: phenylacetate--CoA ligase family protein [Solirubrobacterales bacterium]
MPPRGGERSLATRLAWTAHVVRRAPFEARFPFRPPAAIERAQTRRLAATVAHAHEHVPYYRETMRRIGLAPGEVRSVADLARLPLIERDQVQRDPEYFLSRAEPLDSYVELRSGGSTGDPLSLFHHPFSLFEQAVYTERRRSIISRLARRYRYREARVADIPGSYAGAQHVARAFKGLSLAPPALRVRRRQYEALTPLEELIPRDGMSESARTMISREFGVEVLSTYTASEAFQIGFECEHHRGHHLNVDLFPVRIISDQGRNMPDGESGEVVVSNLQARGTILLNYRLNDIAARRPGRCPCGRTLPLLSLVQGRSDEWLEDAQGGASILRRRASSSMTSSRCCAFS